MSVGTAARIIRERYGCALNPREISTLFYCGVLRDDLCPIEAGRRVIPDSYLPHVVDALRRRGKLRGAR